MAITHHYIILLTALNSLFPMILVDSYNIGDSGRIKRADSSPLPPQKIKINVKVLDEIKKYEVSKLEHNHVANDSLKTWVVHLKGSESDKSIMEKNPDLSRVGTWVMYQNNSDRSAVVYFPKYQFMIGILGKKYPLDYVFYNGTEEFNVTIPYSPDYDRRKREIDGLEESIDNFDLSKKFKRSADKEIIESRHYQFYLESLVFISGNAIKPLAPWLITHGLTQNKKEHYIIHVLSFFNLVDMFFSKTKFKINIAGIIIQEDGSDFPFYTKGAFDSATKKLRLLKANDALLKFISKRKKDLTRDSIDFAIYLTDHLIYNEKTSQTIQQFLTYPKEGIMKAKQNNSEYAYPVIFSPSNLTISSVQQAADRIFYVIGGATYVKNVNSSINETSVIIDNSHNCSRCFRWNEDWCNFVNEPTSLGATPRQLITKDQHCWCNNDQYYFDDKSDKTIVDICRNGFKCQSNNRTEINVTLVMDGIPCDENKVCWNNECVTKAL